ncbi:cyclopropane-fatty-acyl-phospholipid synthase [Stagonosporopsis vannaccii]|nr:cyclopropane-fatty-acyl-phospholipid synthase [Stagonosporopsis vannaccii]
MFTVLATWALGAGLRLSFGDRNLKADCLVFGVAAVCLVREELMVFLHKTWDVSAASAATVGFPIGALALITVPLALLGLSSLRILSNDTKATDLPKDVGKWTLQYPKARIFPCETKHARMFPKRHAFEYSYLQCGFPIIPGGLDTDGRDVAIGRDQYLGRWWLRIRADDYLSRGNGTAGFYGKLQIFMREQEVDDKDWSYGYLVTAPRFFGYSFNPVSFWYIYDREHQLKKMILEVNNTFGERRIYLLDGTGASSPPQTPDSTPGIDAGSEKGPEIFGGSKSRFTDHWMKDFHVSPFNSRKGSYTLRAQNPFPYASYDTPMIDNTITLKSSKDHAKVVARLNCVGTPLDPSEFGLLGAAWFISKWWWVGLVTFPRILKEAFALFCKRGLHVWFRPEVLGPSLGRLPTSSEVTIQQIFHDYLTHLVDTAQDDFRITLHTAIPEVPKQNIDFARPARGEMVKELEIRILTPAFYSRFVHYAYTSEAFDRECIFTDEKNRTCWISRPELLAELLSQSTSARSQDMGTKGSLREPKWSLLRNLRCAPAEPAYNASPQNPESRLEDIRAVRYSEMDVFVRNQHMQDLPGTYRRTVTKLFLAQRFCLGFPQIISLVDWVLRTMLCYCAARQVSNSVGLTWTAMLKQGWWPLSCSIAAVTAGHTYALLKGYH